jgi:hypothetical protein
MTDKKANNNAVELPEQAINWLWRKIVKTYVDKEETKVPESLKNSPSEFWGNRNVRDNFYNDFRKVTTFVNSNMRLFSKNKDGEETDISREYLRDHLITKKEKLFQEDYLNKIIFYITEDKKTAEYQSFFNSNGINIHVSEPNRGEIAPGLKNLEGYWIGLNKNLEAGAFAKCFYRFKQVDNVMQIEREAYNAEVAYHGLVHVQDDSNYLFELSGKTRGKKKFIIADAGKLKPQSIRCISSAFNISTGDPILVKELLVKLPDDVTITISSGFMIDELELEKYLKAYFNLDILPLVLAEINDFLGLNEVPYFSIKDLSNVKQKNLEKINAATVSKENVAKKVSAYIHFNKIGTESYKRNIIKYFKNLKGPDEIPISQQVEVFDEYLFITNTQYEHENYIKHRVFAEANHKSGAVDIQSLFPILENDSDNDLTEPILNYSHRVMDAFSDTFITSATFINDFLPNLRVPMKFDVQTLKSEIVFDFCSVPHFFQSGLYLEEIIYLYNEPDGESLKVIRLKIKDKNKRGFHLIKLNKSIPIIESFENDGIDKINEGIFSIKIDFKSEKDEMIYFQFNTK